MSRASPLHRRSLRRFLAIKEASEPRQRAARAIFHAASHFFLTHTCRVRRSRDQDARHRPCGWPAPSPGTRERPGPPPEPPRACLALHLAACGRRCEVAERLRALGFTSSASPDSLGRLQICLARLPLARFRSSKKLRTAPRQRTCTVGHPSGPLQLRLRAELQAFQQLSD